MRRSHWRGERPHKKVLSLLESGVPRHLGVFLFLILTSVMKTMRNDVRQEKRAFSYFHNRSWNIVRKEKHTGSTVEIKDFTSDCTFSGKFIKNLFHDVVPRIRSDITFH